MIFDYLVEMREPEPHSLSNGFVNPEEIKAKTSMYSYHTATVIILIKERLEIFFISPP